MLGAGFSDYDNGDAYGNTDDEGRTLKHKHNGHEEVQSSGQV